MYCDFVLTNSVLKCSKCGFVHPKTQGKIYRICGEHRQQPTLIEKLKNLNKSGEDWVDSGNEISTDAESQARLQICQTCPNFKNNHCKLCGCFLTLKTILKTSKCPDNPPRW